MRSINPLYILFLTLVTLFFAIHLAHKEERELEFAKEELQNTQELARKLNAIKKAYSPKKKERLLRFIRLRKALQKALKIEKKGDLLILRAKRVSVFDASWLLSKVLNDTYNIKKFSVYRRGESGMSLYMEIE